jgi:hypothetical protein
MTKPRLADVVYAARRAVTRWANVSGETWVMASNYEVRAARVALCIACAILVHKSWLLFGCLPISQGR